MSVTPIEYVADSAYYFERIRHLLRPVLLDSAIAPDKPEIHQRFSRYDIISASPQATLTLKDNVLIQCTYQYQASGESLSARSNQETSTITSGASAFRQLHTLLNALPAQHSEELLPFHGGALGFFSYDLGQTLEAITDVFENKLGTPLMDVGIYHWGIVIDHHLKQAFLVTLETCDPQLLAWLKLAFIDQHPASVVNSSFQLHSTFSSNMTKAMYQEKFERVKAYIQAGDCYQINLSQQFSASFSGDSWQAYQHLSKSLNTPFSAFLDFGEYSILSLSPERFIQVKDNLASTRPIKGTRKRGHTAEEDQENKIALANSQKDKAENVMIVDLLRHDMSRNCDDVRVPELFKIESYRNVHHLVSCVEGRLKPGSHSIDLLRDAFPGGSITGAPKIRAMQIIEELEPHSRSIYCGTIGYINPNGNMDTNIAIRTLLAKDNQLYCWGGGGIVADSEVESEYQESIDKISHMTKGLEGQFYKKD